MRKMTKRERVRGVLGSFDAQYPGPGGVLVHTGGKNVHTAAELRARLSDLDLEKADPKDVDAIMGNSSWTELLCSCCGKDCETVVFIGGGHTWDGPSLAVCLECAKEAVSMLTEEDE